MNVLKNIVTKWVRYLAVLRILLSGFCSERWVETVLCKYLCTIFLGEIFDRIQLVPYSFTFYIEIEKENQNMFILALINLSGIFGCYQNEGQG